MEQHPVAVAVVCVDYRMHHPQSNFMQALYDATQAEKVYVITYPGPDSTCDSEKNANDRQALAAIIQQTRAVLKEHGATTTTNVVVAHSECAGHGVSTDEHKTHTKSLIDSINQELELEHNPFTPLIALKDADDYTWNIREI